MFIGAVRGTVFASQKNPHLTGNRLLIVQPMNLDGEEVGPEYLALDRVDAGVGDLVLMTKEGGGARIVFEDDQIPLQTFIVAVIDEIEVARHFDQTLPPGEEGSTQVENESIEILNSDHF